VSTTTSGGCRPTEAGDGLTHGTGTAAERPGPLPGATPAIETTSLAVVLADDQALQGLIALLIERSGCSQGELCRRMGLSKQSLNQYRTLRRNRPTLQWFVRLAETCGARLMLEFPGRPLAGQWDTIPRRAPEPGHRPWKSRNKRLAAIRSAWAAFGSAP